MIKLGLDFDNTLIVYDALFKKAALEKNLIPNDFPESKNLIRNHLRQRNKEKYFTIIQGEVYGSRISEASQATGMFEALKNIQDVEIELFIVSHKTKTPYEGPKYDLRSAALSWLEKNLFFEISGINIPRENVYFESNKENKIKKIETLGCTHFIDDLPEILQMINPNIKRVLYDPLDNYSQKTDFIHLRNWSDLNKMIL